MRKNFNFKDIIIRFKGLLSLGLSDVVGGVVSSLFWLYLATLLEVETYGELFYLLAIANVGTTISLVGSKDTLSVYVPKNIKLDSAIFLLAIIFGSIVSIIILLMFSNPVVSLYVIGAVMFGLCTAEILAKKLYYIYTKYLFVQKFFMISLSLGLYYWIGMNGIILGISISLFVYSPIVIKIFKANKIDFSQLQPRVGFLMNSYIIDLIASFSKQIDKLAIAPLLGFALLGNYQLGIQFISVFQLLPMIVLKYTLPHDASGNPNKNLKITTVVISACFTILIIFLAPLVIPLFAEKFVYVIEVIQILSISLIPFSISVVYTSKFYGNENSKIVLANVSLSLSSFLLFVFIFVDTMGVFGVAIAYVISVTIPAIFLIIVDLSKTYKS